MGHLLPRRWVLLCVVLWNNAVLTLGAHDGYGVGWKRVQENSYFGTDEDSVIRVGALIYTDPRSFKWNRFGDSRGILTLVVDELNSKGGLLVGGRRKPVELVLVDGEHQQNKTYQRMLDSGIRLFLSSLDGNDVNLGGMHLAAEQGAMTLSYGGFVASFFAGSPLTVSTQVDPFQLYKSILEYSASFNYSKFGLMYIDNSLGAVANFVLTLAAGQLGDAIDYVSYPMPIDDGEYLKTLEKLMIEDDRDTFLVMSTLNSDCARATAGLRQLGLSPKMLIFATCEFPGKENFENVSYAHFVPSWDPGVNEEAD